MSDIRAIPQTLSVKFQFEFVKFQFEFVKFRPFSSSFSESVKFRFPLSSFCQVFVKFHSSLSRLQFRLSTFKIQNYNTRVQTTLQHATSTPRPTAFARCRKRTMMKCPPSQTLYYSRRDDNNWDPDKGVNTTQDQDNQHRLLQESSWRVSVRCILGLHPYPSQHLRSLKTK